MRFVIFSLASIVASAWWDWIFSAPSKDTPLEHQTEETPSETIIPELPPEPVEVPAPPLFPEALPLHSNLQLDSVGMIYASNCAGCHTGPFQQWQNSAHHIGYNQANLQNAIREFGNGSLCISCHLPFAEQQAELTVEIVENDVSRPVLEKNPAWNPNLQLDSVGCASCHVRDGVVLGSKTSESPHPVRNSEELHSSEMCQNCHQFTLPDEVNPLYNTFEEWRQSPYAQAGIQCQDCHMQNGAILGMGFSNHSMELPIRQGITITWQVDSFEWQRNHDIPISIVLHNTGIGHSWPSSSPFKQKELIVQLQSLSGKALVKDIHQNIGPHRNPELAGMTLKVGEQHAYPISINVSSKYPAQLAKLRLIYKEGDEEEILEEIMVKIR